MPSFVSHTIMAKEVYNKIKKNISLDYMVTYSLGGDLSKYAKCRKDSHKIYQKEFIYSLADYIKDNKLTDDSKLLGILYGHICHYVMDNTIHPLVRKLSKNCIYNKKNHTYIEYYIDNYLVDKMYHINIKKYINDLVLTKKMNINIKKILDNTYIRIYNTKSVSLYYKFNISLYRKIKYLYNLFGIKRINKWWGYTKFLDENKDISLINSEIDKLYKESINESIKYINEVNKYIFN